MSRTYPTCDVFLDDDWPPSDQQVVAKERQRRWAERNAMLRLADRAQAAIRTGRHSALSTAIDAMVRKLRENT